MTVSTATHHVIAQSSAVTLSTRANDRYVEIPGDLPGIVIFLHGVNDPGVSYEIVEKGLCQGLNERLSRTDLTPGVYGQDYETAKNGKTPSKADAKYLHNPDLYEYQRLAATASHSGFIPFYWGYRALNDDVAKRSNTENVEAIKGASFDDKDNLMVRGQYQDIRGNRLDAGFAKEGGFFDNATNNIPDMYGDGFKAPVSGKALTRMNLTGNYTYIGDSPTRAYFVLAAHRLAMLVSEIRNIQASPEAAEHGDPKDDTITIIGHSQGTIISLLAQAILVQKGERCADCMIMVDSPYSLVDTDGSKQTGTAKLKTLVDIVNAVTRQPYSIPALASLLIGQETHHGRTGSNWTPDVGKRRGKDGKDWITFDERDNRGKVYLYFCPEDTTVALKRIQGIGTFGVPDTIDGSPAMDALKDKRFYQRMWTRLERDKHADGHFKPVMVGMPPAHLDVRTDTQRRDAGPDSGANAIVNAITTTAHVFKETRFVNGEALKPPYAPNLYGLEEIKGGPSAGVADQAGMMRVSDVDQDIALGNRYAELKWIDVALLKSPPDLDAYKAKFNANKDVEHQSNSWRISPLSALGQVYGVQREQTPAEARLDMEQTRAGLTPNSYHSAILNAEENHRWVTAMDVAIGQAVSLDDPDWRDMLCTLAEWRHESKAMSNITTKDVYQRLRPATQALFEATATYYQSGEFPNETLVPMSLPPLVSSDPPIEPTHPSRGKK